MPHEPSSPAKPAARLRAWHVLVATALVISALASMRSNNEPFSEKLVRVETERALPSLASELQDESPELNLLFLTYSSDPALWMSASLAMFRHGDPAREVLLEYGMLEEFQNVLKRFSSDAVLPIHYFRANDIGTLRARTWISARLDRLKAMFSDAEADLEQELTPYRRGLFAIALLDEHGHGLLDQFTTDDQGRVLWLQGERVVSVVGDFFTSGLRDLEREWRQGNEVGIGELGWAGLDVVVIAGSVKLLRAGKGVRMSRTGQAVGPGRAAAGARFAALGNAAKISAVLGVGYVALRHPSLISAAGTTLSNWLGWPEWVGKFLVWFLVLLPVLFLLRVLVLWVLVPCYRVTAPMWRACANAMSRRTTSTRAVS